MTTSLHEILKDTLRCIEPEKNIVHPVKRKVTEILRSRLYWVRILANIRRHHQSVWRLSALWIILRWSSSGMRLRRRHDVAADLLGGLSLWLL